MFIRLMWRRGLLVLAGATAIAVAAPAVASAATVGTLTVSPTSEPAATPSSDLTVNYTFSGGSPTSLTTNLPAGLLANGTIDGGACLVTPASNTPPAACQIGTATANGTPGLTLYLVQAPNTASDIAGLEIVAGGVNAGVGDVTSRTADGGLTITFSSLPPGLTSLSTTFTKADLRTPTSCPGENFSAGADGQATPTTGTFTTSGCSSLAYNPTMTATVIKDSGDTGAEVISTISQAGAATESATKSTTLGFGTSLAPNSTAVAACFASPCTIGTASATSPVLPDLAFTGGTVTLGGTLLAPTLTITFPVIHLSLVGNIDLTHNTVTFPAQPDFPISSLKVDVTGPSSGGKAFTTTCQAATLTGAFTPWSGTAAVNKSAQIAYQGCPSGGGTTAGKPTASGSISGLPAGHPTLKLKVKHGSNAPNVSSVAIKAPSGLKFHSKCAKKHGKVTCKGLSVSGTIKSVKASGGSLTIVLKKAVGTVKVTVKGPALTETKALQTQVKKHKVKKLNFSVKVKDAKGTTTRVSLKLKA